MHGIIAINTFVTIWLNHLLLVPFVLPVVRFFAYTIDLWVGAFGFIYLFFLSYQKYQFSVDRVFSRFLEAGYACLVIVILWLIESSIKLLTHVPRPYIALTQIMPIATIPSENYQSFPSGHATLFFALATAIYIRHKKAGIVFYICAFLIAISRVIAGVHYIGDILAGVIIGVLGTYCIIWIFSKLLSHFIVKHK